LINFVDATNDVTNRAKPPVSELTDSINIFLGLPAFTAGWKVISDKLTAAGCVDVRCRVKPVYYIVYIVIPLIEMCGCDWFKYVIDILTDRHIDQSEWSF